MIPFTSLRYIMIPFTSSQQSDNHISIFFETIIGNYANLHEQRLYITYYFIYIFKILS